MKYLGIIGYATKHDAIVDLSHRRNVSRWTIEQDHNGWFRVVRAKQQSFLLGELFEQKGSK